MQFNEEIILKGLNLASFDLKTHQLIDSTNDECKRISSNKDILVVTADKQTKGKGRKGKKWHSPEGNISLSIAFADREFDVPISIATGILVKDALTEVFNLDSIKLKWPNDLVFEKKKNLSKLVEKDIKRIADNYAKRFMNNPLNKKPDTSKYFNQGALKAATGAIFEASLDAAFQRSTDKQTATWDVKKNSSKAGDIMGLFGVPNPTGMHGDYKNSLSAGNLKSMAKKIWKTQSEEGWYKRDTKRVKPGRSGGHVPNFSPIADAFKTEAAMGGDPTLDYHPAIGFYVRDKDTQKGIGDVRRDHPEGLGRAAKNSKKMAGNV